MAATLGLQATACSDGASGGNLPSLPDGGAGEPDGGAPCPAGEWLAEDGSCVPAGENAGVAPEACAEGFTPSDSGGCLAVLPPEPCGGGLMAVPGESSCRAIAACGSAPWGAIPVEDDTQHVDAAYAGTASDGSDAAPW